jgi:hypothetical protein
VVYEDDIETGVGACSGPVVQVEAFWTCDDIGARLCSIDELLNDETRGSVFFLFFLFLSLSFCHVLLYHYINLFTYATFVMSAWWWW